MALERPRWHEQEDETQWSIHSAYIWWTAWDGSRTGVHILQADSPEAAWTQALRVARDSGWTPPRWWQWWRWRDTRLPTDKSRGFPRILVKETP